MKNPTHLLQKSTVRFRELGEGKVCALGGKRELDSFFANVLQECDRSVPTVVLCLETERAARSFREGDTVALLEPRKGQGGRFPDFIELFLKSPVFGRDLDSIVGCLGDTLTEKLPAKTSNDLYWMGNGAMLQDEIFRACLLGMKWDNSFGTASFVRTYRKICDELPRMVASDPARPSFSFSYSSSWVKALDASIGMDGFSETLVGVPPSTAQTVLNTYYSQTEKLRELMRILPAEDKSGSAYFSLLDYLQNPSDGALFLVLPSYLKSFAPVISRLLLCGIAANERTLGKIRLIVPDVSLWRDPTGVERLLDETGEDVSVIWGVSRISLFEALGKGNALQCMVSLSESRVWARSADSAAGNLYEYLIPASLRMYPLSRIPSGQCFVESPDRDFECVVIPYLPENGEKSGVGEEFPEANAAVLWQRQPQKDFPVVYIESELKTGGRKAAKDKGNR